ncbi:MAG: hypothetical protein [Bacteriophage sp.]|nr:MAG: hypothetical protein [Bacteriophage sp.]
MEILINKDYGCFDLSEEVEKLILKERGLDVDNLSDTEYLELREEVLFDDNYDYRKELRTNTDVLRIVKQLGLKRSSGKWATLGIAVVPNNTYFTIREDYDGIEHVQYSFTPIKEAKYLDDEDYS